MSKRNQLITIIIFLLFALGLTGAMYDDPIEQVGILLIFISSYLSIRLVFKLTTTDTKTTFKTFSVIASVIYLTNIARIFQYPFGIILVFSAITVVGFCGLIVLSVLNMNKDLNLKKSDLYIIVGSGIILFYLINYIFQFGLASNYILRIIIYSLIFLVGIILLWNTEQAKRHPAIITITLSTLTSVTATIVIKLYAGV